MSKSKSEVLYDFWNSFTIPAYDETSVPDDALFPRITYSVSEGNLGQINMSNASIWYKETTWKNASQKVEEIGRYIDNMTPWRCEDGYIYITRGTPFAQRMKDEDDRLRRYVLNVSIEYLTSH